MTDADERRRVAERLRAQARTVSHDSRYLWKRLEIAVNGWSLGAVVDESYVFDNDVLSRLADLIDPTCEVESVDSTGGLLSYRLSCGHTAYRPAYVQGPPPVCPSCGARLVRDGDE